MGLKSVIIIVIAVVLLIPFSAFAQEESLSEMTARLDAENLQKSQELGSITQPTNPNTQQQSLQKIDCPKGTYQGLDNQRNPACRDLKTNQIVDSNTGLTYDSQTGEIILDDEQMLYVGIGIFIVIVVVAVIAKASTSNSSSDSETKSFARRGWTEDEKLEVRKRQHGVCKKCNNPPPRWQYDHIDGDHSNNDLSNCQGLCPNCHDVKTYEES